MTIKMIACCLECNGKLRKVGDEKAICINKKCEMFTLVVSNWYWFEEEVNESERYHK